jgi:hypothetical protein
MQNPKQLASASITSTARRPKCPPAGHRQPGQFWRLVVVTLLDVPPRPGVSAPVTEGQMQDEQSQAPKILRAVTSGSHSRRSGAAETRLGDVLSAANE